MAGLPGASLPWPEGEFGLATMVALSGLTLAVVLLALHPRGAADLLLGLHSRIERILEKAEHLTWPPRPCRRHPGRGRGLEPQSRRGRLASPENEPRQ